ncbi:MAG TPA: twin-arginine translocase subunit TatC [Cryomorphaceae bacterium]|nr:twin-arginine translocase subunit TatC [Cryomorphaceae bacterium]
MSTADSMTFLEHLGALRKHLMRASLAVLIAAGLAFAFRDVLFDDILLAPKSTDFITYQWFCDLGKWIGNDSLCLKEIKMDLLNSKMAGQFSLHIGLSLMAGLVIAFPFVLRELWLFIAPGLTDGERRKSVAFIGISSMLFFSGALFGYYVITPLSIQFLANYIVSEEITNLIEMGSYLSTVASIVVACGVLFELPIVVYFLSRVGIVTPQGMRTYRRHSWIGILALAAIITPPDVFSQIIVTIPVAILYEASILVSAAVQPKQV